jgi:hypothetical protein
MRVINPDHPEWKYKMGKKAWLGIKKRLNDCKGLFLAGCNYAHWKAERCNSLDKLKELVLEDLKSKNRPELLNRKHPLSLMDVEWVAEKLAVSAWDWQQKKISQGTQRKINWGAMEFPRMRGLDWEAYCEETKRRQKLSAIRTHEMRSKKTYDKIMYAIFLCKADNIKITKTLIAQMTGVRREELSRRYSYCFEHKTIPCIHQTTHQEKAEEG